MQISPFFRNLRSAYQAEIDDLCFDSEGKDILRKRLTQRRGEMEFLVHMIEMSPEMVAVVFHQGMRFTSSKVMEHLVAQDSDELPEWAAVESAIELAPWAQPLLQQALKQPQGEWFMTLAAALEYMHHRHDPSIAAHSSDDEDDEREDNHDADEAPIVQLDSDTAVEPMDREASEEAGAEWMAAQGFERKE